MDKDLKEELIKKYQWAGKIRFISCFLLFSFLLLLKFSGGYSYLNSILISLILVEALLNQPYNFFLKRVNIYRFQFYQMLVDIIVISWIVYYMGGLEAPVVTIAYYAVILWAGVVSGLGAVVFAVICSSFPLSSIVILEYLNFLPLISFLNYKMSLSRVVSLLLGNIGFLFAFGYFSAHSSKIEKLLERKRQEDALRYTHKLLATGHLVSGIAHDIINHLVSIGGYAQLLKDKNMKDSYINGAIKNIKELVKKSTELLYRLSKFSRKPKEKFESGDLHQIIEEALRLTQPLIKASGVRVERFYERNLPLIKLDKERLQEVFVALILNSLDALSRKGKISIKTKYLPEEECVEVLFSDTGVGIPKEYLGRVKEPFFSTKGRQKALGLGLTIASEVVERHKGEMDIESIPMKGTTVKIKLPLRV